MQRTAYIAVLDEKPGEVFHRGILLLDEKPPRTPYIKVKIIVKGQESRYEHERGNTRVAA